MLNQLKKDVEKELKDHQCSPVSTCQICLMSNVKLQLLTEVEKIINSQQNKTTKDNNFSKVDLGCPASAEGLDSRTISADFISKEKLKERDKKFIEELNNKLSWRNGEVVSSGWVKNVIDNLATKFGMKEVR